jgi:hypothetical protein
MSFFVQRSSFNLVVIPERAESANPESSHKLGLHRWIPGLHLRCAPE